MLCSSVKSIQEIYENAIGNDVLFLSPSFVLCSELLLGPSTVADFISCSDLAPLMELFLRSAVVSTLTDWLDSLLCCEASEMLLSDADFTISVNI